MTNTKIYKSATQKTMMRTFSLDYCTIFFRIHTSNIYYKV